MRITSSTCATPGAESSKSIPPAGVSPHAKFPKAAGKMGGAHGEQSHLARNTRYSDTIPRKTRRGAGKTKGATTLASLKDSNFPKAVAASPQLRRTAPQALQYSSIQRFLQPRLARPVNQCRKKKRSVQTRGRSVVGLPRKKTLRRGVISAYGPRRGDKTRGATLVADTEKKSLETRTRALPRIIGRFD